MVEEEAWNAYPYTKTIYKCPFVAKLYLEIETCYKNDNGEQENIFDLSGCDIRDRTIGKGVRTICKGDGIYDDVV